MDFLKNKFQKMNFYIFRHGQTIYSKQNIPYGTEIESADIIPEGKPVTIKLAKYLEEIETDGNFCSPYKRCRHTIELIESVSNKTFTYDPRLGEFNQESFTGFAQRIKNFLDELAMTDLKSVAICTHGGVIAGISMWLTKNHFLKEELDNYPRCGTLTIIKDSKLELIDFN